MTTEGRRAGDPGETLGVLVKRAHLRLTALADAALEPFGLGRKEFGVLRVLAAGEALSQQALAARLGVDATTMVGLIDLLQTEGIVTRRPDPADRRRNAIELTAAGRRLHSEAAAAFTAAEAAFLAPLGDADAERFQRALRTLLASGGAAG